MVSFESIKGFSLFRGLNDEELKKVADLCRRRSLNKDDFCFSQGRQAMELHLCCSGRVDILVRINEPWSKEVAVYTAKEGEVFGWSALVEPYFYTASARCAENVEEMFIKGAELIKLFEQEWHIGYQIMKNLSAVISSRLTESRAKLTREIAAASSKEW